jgi:hypothetical protein
MVLADNEVFCVKSRQNYKALFQFIDPRITGNDYVSGIIKSGILWEISRSAPLWKQYCKNPSLKCENVEILISNTGSVWRV